jgi:hypothetical protein
MSHDLPAKTQLLIDLAKLFVKLGITAFGGRAAHIAIKGLSGPGALRCRFDPLES